MATIINTPGSTNEDTGGWAVALIVILAVIVVGFFWLRGRTVTPATPNTGGTVQVNIPTNGTPAGSSNTNAGASSQTTSGSSGSYGAGSGSTGGSSSGNAMTQ